VNAILVGFLLFSSFFRYDKSRPTDLQPSPRKGWIRWCSFQHWFGRRVGMGVVVGYGGSRRMGKRQGEMRDGFGIA